MGRLFPAREILVSDIPAGDGKNAKPLFTVHTVAPTQRIINWKKDRLAVVFVTLPQELLEGI